MKLMNATFPFQVCIHKETDRELEKISTKGHKAPTDVQLEEMIVQLDGIIWGKVLENCKKHFGDSEKGLILLHYSGNNAKALGYWEGVVYSARAYVISRTISYEQANHP